MDISVYKSDVYTTDAFDYIVGNKITEFDIKEAGYNLSIYYGLLSSKKLNILEKLPKHRRRIQIGIWMRDDNEYNTSLTKSFAMMRKKFMETNNLCDDDVLSIKKDAIFIIGKDCEHTLFGNVEFVRKNVYSSYHRFGNIQMYFNRKKNILDIKGIDDKLLPSNKLFMDILKRVFTMLEYNDHSGFVTFMKKFVSDYKNCRLAYGYYRELNQRSLYSIKSSKDDIYKYYVPDVESRQFDEILDISYNYREYILPMIQRFYFK